VVRGLVVEQRSQDLCLRSHNPRRFVPLPSSPSGCGSPRPRQHCASPSAAGALEASASVSKEHRGTLSLIGLSLIFIIIITIDVIEIQGKCILVSEGHSYLGILCFGVFIAGSVDDSIDFSCLDFDYFFHY